METKEEMNKERRDEFREDNNIGKLRRRMYSRERKGFLPWRKRRDSAQESPLVKDAWEYNRQKDEPIQRPQTRESSYSGASALLIFSIIFFVLSGVGALTYLKMAAGTATAGSVDISIEGSTAISAGDVLELQILVTNRNDAALKLADLVVRYPEGTVSPADFQTPLRAERIPLGSIDPRSARRGAIRAVILGNNGEAKDIKVELQYRLAGSSVIHSRSTNHSALISTNAMSISVDANKELTPGQSVPVVVTVKSHSTTILSDAYLDVALPFGFVLESSSPLPVGGIAGKNNNFSWNIGALRPGEERTIQFSGTLDGQAGDSRTLVMSTGSGMTDIKNNKIKRTVLAKAEHSIIVSRPFLSVVLESDGVRLDDFVARAGEPFNVTVRWFNNLNVPINNATIALTLGGSALNKAGVDAGQKGFYRSVDSLILWDSKTDDTLKVLAPGASGKFKFKLTPLPQSYLEKIRTPALSFVVHAAGKRLSEQGVPEVLKEESSSNVKIATNSSFTAYSLFKSSPFGTMGPLPPKVEYETTYGVVWELSNTTSDIEEAIVSAELPHYVRWVGVTTPANEQLLYNKANNTLEWHIGTVKAGTGISQKTRSVSFAIGLVPSATQIGQTPDLVRNQTFSAIDTYTGQEINMQAVNVNTRTPRDENYDASAASVVK